MIRARKIVGTGEDGQLFPEENIKQYSVNNDALGPCKCVGRQLIKMVLESNMNKRKMIGAHSALALLALAVSQVHAADPTVQQGREDRAEKAAQKTLAKMTMEEKLAYIGGTGGWDVKPLTNYGVP
ncbi:beta-glucosidase, partial [Pseudomonas syringae pv. actinidiae ICMP 18804]